ncbi:MULTISPECIES: enoyl-CoA hydratase [Leeia]|uniref:Enoyl-CoA hydratase n=1 Tax=Leeia aquatica TaxID=2725557 RepID=A0A847S7Y8_9NEIS|nr:enoyl-CoA hydratase [Leeia aquatica]NLR73746.1 enoyl-CoA hydratase [Leeia aquatica]
MSIELEKRGHVAIITIANPPANTWTVASLTALRDTVRALNEDKDIYSLILTGQGEKFFSAGADLNQFASGDKGVAASVSRIFGEAFEALATFRGVSIAAINGYAMGGGLEAALACDLRVVEAQAVMALPEAKVGLLPCAGGTQNLAWLAGEGWAKRMILLGERVDAATALQIGLAEEVVAKGQALEKALELAAKVEQQSPVSVMHCKALIQSSRMRGPYQVLPEERERFVMLFDSEDQKEGVTAFLEKRSPQWKNR